MDGSLKEDLKTPSTYEYNIGVTAQVVDMAHEVGVSVEGELGCLGSLETGEAGEEDGAARRALSHEQLLTDPGRPRTSSSGPASMRWPSPSARRTAPTSSRRGPDGRHPCDRSHSGGPRSAFPTRHLVMHGSSSVPQEWLAIIREHGGQFIKETYGVPVEQIQQGIRNGVRKVNIDTDIRIAMTGAMRRLMNTEPAASSILASFFVQATAAARDICRARFEAFGSAGQASRIKPLPMAAVRGGLRQGGVTLPVPLRAELTAGRLQSNASGRPADFSFRPKS